MKFLATDSPMATAGELLPPIATETAAAQTSAFIFELLSDSMVTFPPATTVLFSMYALSRPKIVLNARAPPPLNAGLLSNPAAMAIAVAVTVASIIASLATVIKTYSLFASTGVATEPELAIYARTSFLISLREVVTPTETAVDFFTPTATAKDEAETVLSISESSVA